MRLWLLLLWLDHTKKSERMLEGLHKLEYECAGLGACKNRQASVTIVVEAHDFEALPYHQTIWYNEGKSSWSLR